MTEPNQLQAQAQGVVDSVIASKQWKFNAGIEFNSYSNLFGAIPHIAGYLGAKSLELERRAQLILTYTSNREAMNRYPLEKYRNIRLVAAAIVLDSEDPSVEEAKNLLNPKFDPPWWHNDGWLD